MTLQRKILDLRLQAALAAKHAQFWQHAIDTHGEEKATAFYTHLDLNHLETKSFEWEGLKLSREPKEHEKIAVKGIANAQESAKELIGSVLMRLRADLITDGLKRIKKLKPANYHELVLQASKESRLELSEQLVKAHRQGRMLVFYELGGQKSVPIGLWEGDGAGSEIVVSFKQDDDDFDELDDLVDLTTSRVTNDVQSRLIDAAARHALLGQTAAGLINAVTNELNSGSVTYIDRASRGLANRVINIGRSDEAEARSDEWERVTYSALLDPNVCSPCASFDGQEATNEDDLEPAPSPSCEGGENCRCFHVFVSV